MINKNIFKKIGIVGFGREGKAVYDYFKNTADVFYIFDKNENIEILSKCENFLGEDYKEIIIHKQSELDVIFRSPGVPLWDIEDSLDKNKLTTITNYFFEECRELGVKIIGVTGTKGKGTTATLIYEILKADGQDVYLVGNIGSPALNIIDELKDKKNQGIESVIVYEMSSFQLYDIKYSPNIAVCLLITEDHLDWHKNVQQYRYAKENIFKLQNKNDKAIYYAQNEYSSQFAHSSPAQEKICYGSTIQADVRIRDGYYEFLGSKIISITDVKLPGEHNQQNVMAAIAATYDLVKSSDSIVKVLKEFAGLKYHIETVGEKKGVRFVNDSFSVNPTSSSVAIDSFSENTILILGGVDRGLNLDDFAEKLAKSKNLKKIILYGKFGKRLNDWLTKLNTQNVVLLDDEKFEEIFNFAVQSAKSGEVVLFSPGAPSFDMFENYIKRGEKFDQLVKEL